MPSYNKVILAGNLTRDIELRYTPKGTAVAACGLAINRRWRTDAGEEKEEVTFVDFDAFGRTAEVLEQYTRKGDPILIEGRLKLDTWDDKQTNQKRQKLKVIVESFQFLAYRGDDADGAGDHDARRAPAPAKGKPTPTARELARQSPEYVPPPVDDDVPF